jgi:hypothetical protein
LQPVDQNSGCPNNRWGQNSVILIFLVYQTGCVIVKGKFGNPPRFAQSFTTVCDSASVIAKTIGAYAGMTGIGPEIMHI